jgi:hypothetical protein
MYDGYEENYYPDGLKTKKDLDNVLTIEYPNGVKVLL